MKASLILMLFMLVPLLNACDKEEVEPTNVPPVKVISPPTAPDSADTEIDGK